MEQTLSKHIVFEYLAGRTTPLENNAVEEWLKNPEHAGQFYQWLLEWETQSPQYVPDTDAAFQKLLLRLEEAAPGTDFSAEEGSGRRRWLRTWLSAAAILFLVTLGGWLLRKPILYRTYQTEYGQTSSFVLPDGSRVTLNANSTLHVPRFSFEKGLREVQLVGEAEFSVKHTQDHRRFVVKTVNQFQVEVLGTEFTVYARPRGSRVALTNGKIRLDYTQGATQKQLLMNPGELATMNPNGDLTVESKGHPDVESAWKEHRFVFDNTSLAEICVILEENFGLSVRTNDPEIAARTITGNFKAQTAEDLLDVLKEVLNLEIRKEKKTLLLLNPSLNPKS
jgi:transmembrane sensor